MAKSSKELQSRKLTQEESSSVRNPNEKQANVEWLASQFMNSNTQKPIEVGEGIEIGPFDDEIEGSNWVEKHLPEVTKGYGWGANKEGKIRGKSTVVQPRPGEDGKIMIWIKRIK